MHSSRICTARLLTISRSARWRGSAQPPNPPPHPDADPLEADPLLDADPPPLLEAYPLDSDPPRCRPPPPRQCSLFELRLGCVTNLKLFAFNKTQVGVEFVHSSN